MIQPISDPLRLALRFGRAKPCIRRGAGLGILGLSLSMGILAVASAAAPDAKAAGSVVVPAEQAAMGRVYYVVPGEDAQVVFSSDAPLERVVGVSSSVIGYAVAPSDGTPIAGLLKGEFRVGVATFDTGLPVRDAHLQSGRWLNAAEHPDIVFTLDHTEAVARVDDADGAANREKAEVWSVDLVGVLTVLGVDRPLRSKATITLMPESRLTKIRTPGDLLIIRTAFSINLREYGFNDPSMSVGMVAEDIDLDVFLLLTTAPPEVGE